MDIGGKIKFLRKNQGLTQTELATKSHISRSYLADVEKNRYNPSLDTLKSIAEALGIAVDELLRDQDSNTVIEKDTLIKEIESMPNFEDGEGALKFILMQPSMQDFGGYNLKEMSEEEIIEIANDMLLAMRISIEKMKKRK